MSSDLKAGRETFNPVGDAEIRAALRAYAKEFTPTARVVDEVAIGYSRIDLLSITPAQLIGFEVKSWRDSLAKLEQQARDYSRVVTGATLVATARHMDAATKIVPEWWGLLLVMQDDDRSVTLLPHRDAEINPAIDVCALAGLLWTDELRAILRTHDATRGTSRYGKRDLAKAVHGCAELRIVHAAILRTLYDREDWRDENGRAINRLTTPSHPPTQPTQENGT